MSDKEQAICVRIKGHELSIYLTAGVDVIEDETTCVGCGATNELHFKETYALSGVHEGGIVLSPRNKIVRVVKARLDEIFGKIRCVDCDVKFLATIDYRLNDG